MNKLTPTYNDLLAIQMHMLTALKNVILLHSRDKKKCNECQVDYPCLTFEMVNTCIQHIEVHVEKIKRNG